MFHALALVTLSLFLIFTGTTFIGMWRGVIRKETVAWDEMGFVPKAQLIHSWFAIGLLILILATLVAAPVPWYIWIVMLANFLGQHVSLRIDIPISPKVLKALKWVSLVAEALYLVYLAFGV